MPRFLVFLIICADVTVLGLVGGAPGGKTPRVASLQNPKHARHAPLHPHDVDAFLNGTVERRPLAPNVNVYRVAVPF